MSFQVFQLASFLVALSWVESFSIMNRPGQIYTPPMKYRDGVKAPDDKLWLMSVSGTIQPYSSLSSSGKLEGFTIEFMDMVCKEAGKRCKVILTPTDECSFTTRNINYPGRGLMEGWFDGCPGYGITVDRLNTFEFTIPYLRIEATFAVMPGNPKSFDPTSDDYSNFTLVHLDWETTNEKCLYRLGKKFGNVIIVKTLPEAVDILKDGRGDVFFSPNLNVTGLEILPQQVRCVIDGLGMLVKKGAPLKQWWDQAFTRIFDRGDYTKFCKEAKAKYQFDFLCVDKITDPSSARKALPYHKEKFLYNKL